MSLELSDLTSDERELLLAYLKNQLGDLYNKIFQVEDPEERLSIIFTMHAGAQEYLQIYRAIKAEDRRKRRINRWICFVDGAILGLFYGFVLVGFAWVVNQIWSIPFWYSLASTINGALPMLIFGAMISWISNKANRAIAYRHVLTVYVLFSLIGGIIGSYRYTTDSQWSVKNTILVIWKKFENLEMWIFGIFLCLILLFLLFDYLGVKAEYNLRFDINPWDLETTELATFWAFIILFVLAFPITLWAVLVDAFHFNPWVAGEVVWMAAQVNRLPWVIAPGIVAFVGMMLGLILPGKQRKG